MLKHSSNHNYLKLYEISFDRRQTIVEKGDFEDKVRKDQ